MSGFVGEILSAEPIWAALPLIASFLAWIAGDVYAANKAGLSNRWAAALNDLFNGRFSCLVLGIGGSGKSTLGQVLQHRLRHAAPLKNPVSTERIVEDWPKLHIGDGVQPYKISGLDEFYRIAHSREMRVAPGQDQSNLIWPPKIAEAARAPRALIVNVMAFGHTAPELINTRNYKEIADAYQIPGGSPAEFREAYSLLMLERELEATWRIVRAWPEGAKAKLVFMNAINMGGFWWSRFDEVKNHYSGAHSPYKTIEHALRERVGPDRLVYYPFLPCSFLRGDMRDRDGNVIFFADVHGVEHQSVATKETLEILSAELYRADWRKPALRRTS